MRIEWINHASFLISEGETRLLCDPWVEGNVFDNSWSLISPTRFSYQDFARVTHIWFSHEHPDHFSPPNLKNIPPEVRRKITVLFQPTKDRRVVKFCRNLGFGNVVELPADWYSISRNLQIFCQPASRGDSWLAIRSEAHSVLNLNDCVYLSHEELRPVKQAVGPLDVLVTQFSYASWWANRVDVETWKKASRDTLEKIGREIEVLQPRHVILAASFVFFCHEENQYMNEHINRVDRAYQFVKGHGIAGPVVLYPGDVWMFDESWNSESALNRYILDYARALENPVKVHARRVDVDQLMRGALSFVRTLRRNNSDLLLRRVPPASVYITDHRLSVSLGLSGLTQLGPLSYECHDIALSSEALLYCLRFPWGGETLMINGRFEAPSGGNYNKALRWFSIAQANSRGDYYNRQYYLFRLKNKAAQLVRGRVPVAQ